MSQREAAGARRLEQRREEETLRAATGLRERAALRALVASGLKAGETPLLPLIPALRVAWAGDRVDPRERRILETMLSELRIGDGATRAFVRWIEERPAEAFFDAALFALVLVLRRAPVEARRQAVDGIRRRCLEVARASGGVVGVRRRSREERRLLDEIDERLRTV